MGAGNPRREIARYKIVKAFQNASEAFKLANPHIVTPSVQKLLGTVAPKRCRTMNKTEAEFAVYLESLKRNGTILRYEFEGITLRWADMRYTPDFVVFSPPFTIKPATYQITLVEVKGGHIWSRDIVRFKGARAYWPEFTFEMHQKTKQGWKRLH